MSFVAARKPVKTYSRRKPISNVEEPPSKRRRVDSAPVVDKGSDIVRSDSPAPTHPSLEEPNSYSAPLSSPKDVAFPSSEAPVQFTPPSSPPQSSPILQQRKPIFSFFRRKSAPASTGKDPLSERNVNAQPTIQPTPKPKRLTQMQLDLGESKQKKCKICGMEYVPSNVEDAAFHKKFHAKSIGGVDITKAFAVKLKENQVWEDPEGNFISVIRRHDPPAFRNKATEVLTVVNTELAAVTIPDETLWSQTSLPELPDTGFQGKKGTSGSDEAAMSLKTRCDRFKVYIYVRGQKCVGACIAERIREAFTVLDPNSTAGGKGEAPVDLHGSSISVSSEAETAILGISRIWTSNLHRNRRIASTLLDVARSDFLYGMTIPKSKVAFSQPTESGGRLACKWFGQLSGWHVYVD